MSKYLVFNNAGLALAAERKMFAWMQQDARDNGRTVMPGPNGGIVSTRMGVDDPTAQMTMAWATPRARLTDGKRVFEHPEQHISVVGNATARAAIMASIGGQVSEEDDAPDWWPDDI